MKVSTRSDALARSLMRRTCDSPPPTAKLRKHYTPHNQYTTTQTHHKVIPFCHRAFMVRSNDCNDPLSMGDKRPVGRAVGSVYSALCHLAVFVRPMRRDEERRRRCTVYTSAHLKYGCPKGPGQPRRRSA